MTAIAYRDGVMAADSRDHAGGVLMGFVKKIARRSDGALAAAAGDAAYCEEFLALFVAGRDEDYRPIMSGDSAFSAVVVTPPGGAIWQVNHLGRYRIDAPFYAEGSAYQLLIGAMAAGASAEDAVRIAVKYDGRCGGEIHIEHL